MLPEKDSPTVPRKSDVDFVALVLSEVEFARRKFPSNKVLFAALVEEVGEVAKALQDETRERVMSELVQVAAMALRLAVEGDPAYSNSLPEPDGNIF